MARNDGRTLKIQVVGDIKDIKKDVAEVNKTVGGLGKAAKMVGGAVIGAFALDTVVDFAKGAIDAASDLSESMSKVEVVFGDTSDAIKEWSRTSSTAMGLSQQKALDAAGTFGNLFDALKLSEEATVDMSKGAVQLAADLASFNNADISETLAAIQSGLLGEAEPMRRFGSNLSAARVEAYALAQGWVKNKSALTDAMKVQARYALILQDTTNAQGDFGRTSDGLANSQRILNAELENLSAEIGMELQPIMRDFAVFAKDELVPALRDVLGIIKELGSYSEELGTILSIVTMNVGAQNAAVEDYFAALDPWVRTFHDLGEELGYSRVQLFRLSDEFRRGGKDIVAFGEYLGSLRKEKPEAILPTPEEVSEATTVLPTLTKVAVRQTERSLSALVGISRTTLKATRDEVRDRMRDIRDALEHPFRDDNLEKTYRNAVKRGTKAMNKALREGNEEAYAEASQFVADYKAKLRELRMQRFRVRVSMFIDDSGVTGPGATLLGGAAGAAWGTARGRRAKPKKHATGLDYVPFDDYPALLHRGERVVPAAENRDGSGGVTITVNGYVGSEEQLGRVINRHLAAFVQRGGRLGYR